MCNHFDAIHSISCRLSNTLFMYAYLCGDRCQLLIIDVNSSCFWPSINYNNDRKKWLNIFSMQIECEKRRVKYNEKFVARRINIDKQWTTSIPARDNMTSLIHKTFCLHDNVSRLKCRRCLLSRRAPETRSVTTSPARMRSKLYCCELLRLTCLRQSPETVFQPIGEQHTARRHQTPGS